MSIENLTEPQR